MTPEEKALLETLRKIKENLFASQMALEELQGDFREKDMETCEMACETVSEQLDQLIDEIEDALASVEPQNDNEE